MRENLLKKHSISAFQILDVQLWVFDSLRRPWASDYNNAKIIRALIGYYLPDFDMVSVDRIDCTLGLLFFDLL